jgi:hypothetical protein
MPHRRLSEHGRSFVCLRGEVKSTRKIGGSIDYYVKGSTAVHEFELRVIRNGIELSGGQLKGLLVFPECEPERALRLVRFLSQKEGGVMRIFNAEGKLIKERRFDTATPTADAVGGFGGPRRESSGFIQVSPGSPLGRL